MIEIETDALVFVIILLAGFFVIYQDYEYECRIKRKRDR